jgi:hypothetical protein
VLHLKQVLQLLEHDHLQVKFSKCSVGVLYLGYRESPVTTKKSRYDQFPPAVNDWGTMHPVPDMAPPLLSEEEGSST